MNTKEIQLVDAGQKTTSLGEQIVVKFTKRYLGFVDNLIREYVKDKPKETINKDYKKLLILEENWEVMRSDLDTLLQQLNTIVHYEDVDKRYARKDGNLKTQNKASWKIEQFYLYGNQVERGIKRSQKTASLIKNIPGKQTALFSILQPGTHIKKHCGEYAGLLRYHLGLKVNDPSLCKLRVEDQIINWEEGKAFIFDHTLEHEAWNNSDSIRVILILDFIRKLPLHLSILNRIGLQLLKRSKHIKQAVYTLENGPLAGTN
ncbi:aspartyl/asparaginyl beta-hydroxylase domain-containing protein [Aquimarina aggregata]|uniref:aspartyl/asparaginyl beta-hydroxylase domain-containing protein n=1 Tax=Aquimarina aggregata TaxID=1642818 RepID=UPI00249120F0|nr:aspartyl/asparaginyl beta-hydroxylase domain-containing protein [Aquimarina aggregata]